jgi:CheY-like chemotaxis protein
VDGIVTQSGGAVRVETKVSVGTQFSVLLPRAKQPPPPPPRYTAESQRAAAPSFETVLVCDDDDGVRQLIVDVLALRGYRVLSARNGEEALHVARDHGARIHLLVSDVVMPALGGLELARQLRERDPALRVLFISGYADEPTRLAGPLGPHVHFLSKPFTASSLTQSVCTILESSAP